LWLINAAPSAKTLDCQIFSNGRHTANWPSNFPQRTVTTWPLSRLVDIWNSIPGQREVHTFPHRGKAVARIWNAIQALGKNGSASEKEAALPKETSKRKAPRKRRGAKRAPTGKKVATDSERSNKKAAVIAMMKRAKGATLAEIVQATSWQPHTVRGFVSILGSKGGQKDLVQQKRGG
jgi:hypothetical protein